MRLGTAAAVAVTIVVTATVVLAACSTATGRAGRSAGPAASEAPSVTSAPAPGAPARCPRAPRAAFAGTASGIRIERSAGLLKCRYRPAKVLPHTCAAATVVIDTAPQVFRTFQRWTVETGQNAMWTDNPALNPRPVPGVGIEAEWVPATRTFATATRSSWVTVFLDCPAGASGARALAESLARMGLAAAR